MALGSISNLGSASAVPKGRLTQIAPGPTLDRVGGKESDDPSLVARSVALTPVGTSEEVFKALVGILAQAENANVRIQALADSLEKAAGVKPAVQPPVVPVSLVPPPAAPKPAETLAAILKTGKTPKTGARVGTDDTVADFGTLTVGGKQIHLGAVQAPYITRMEAAQYVAAVINTQREVPLSAAVDADTGLISLTSRDGTQVRIDAVGGFGFKEPENQIEIGFRPGVFSGTVEADIPIDGPYFAGPKLKGHPPPPPPPPPPPKVFRTVTRKIFDSNGFSYTIDSQEPVDA